MVEGVQEGSRDGASRVGDAREIVGAITRRLWLPATLLGLAWARVATHVPTYPVIGSVVVDGRPASGARVTFHPAGGMSWSRTRPTAEVGRDGSFQVAMDEERPGVPAGRYRVTIVWRSTIRAGSEELRGPNLLPARYADPGTTPITVEVVPGPNRLPTFEFGRSVRWASGGVPPAGVPGPADRGGRAKR